MERTRAILIGGVAAGIAWLIGMTVFFGPAQGVLTDPSIQSAKFLAVFGSLEPLPRMTTSPWVLPAGLLVLGTLHSFVFGIVSPALHGSTLRRGLAFGGVAWALMVPWFEFYLPWNVMWEPMRLVLLEATCWLGVQLLVGVALAFSHARFAGNTDRSGSSTDPPA
jgi:hypothetical protein